MGTSMGFSQIVAVVGKLFLVAVIFVLVGIPLLTGVGVGLLLFVLHMASGLFLSLVSNPIGLFLVGILTLVLFQRQRKKRNESEEEE